MSNTNIPLVASGGVSSVDDISLLSQQNYKSIKGVIVGKAIYDNEFDIKNALEIYWLNMLKKKNIPCLDVDNGRVVKGVNFVDLVDAGDPVEQGQNI